MFSIFVINPGSTSTKLALFEDDKNVWEKKVFHDSHDLEGFSCINDQLDYRFEMIKDILRKENIDISNLDAIVGRGGGCASVESGVFEVNEKLVKDSHDLVGGIEHSSMLGVQLAWKFRELVSCRMFMLDPTLVDEYCDIARMTGIKGVYRTPSSHTLNQKGVAMKYAKSIGKKYDELNLIVAHIDGGITIGAHCRGRMIDGNSGAGGDGPYTPSRIGSVNITDFIDYAKGRDLDEIRHLCNIGGGFTSLLGTNDADVVMERIKNGDTVAKRAWDGMVYQIAKYIGSMATVMYGKVDQILLTGGLLRFQCIIDEIEKRCGWIAPITCYPGEVEMEAMASGAMRVLTGKETPKIYDGKPVFTGFDDER